jgi:CheY-like chemotaxis protein
MEARVGTLFHNTFGRCLFAIAGSSTDTPAHVPSSVIAPLTIPHDSVRRVPASVMGTGFVLYLEDNDDLREVVVELVTVVLERRCVGVGSYEELVGLGEEALGCSVAILDINLGPDRRSGIDAYSWLRDNGYTGRIVFLTGHASTYPLVVEGQRISDAEIFSKPIDADRLRSIVEGEGRG